MKSKLLNFRKLKVSKKLVSILMVLVIALSIIPLGTLSASASGVVVSKGEAYSYGSGINWQTHLLTADGDTAYCVQPSLNSPTGTLTNVTAVTDKNLIKALYYGYSGDGFTTKLSSINSTMKAYMDTQKTTYWLGASGNSLYYLLTHRALAYLYNASDWNYALPADWQNAVKNVANAMKAAPDVSSTGVYLIQTGSTKTQNVIYMTSTGDLSLIKKSSNEAISNSNNCYSLEGAVYEVYDSGSKKVGTIKTNASGKGSLKGLPKGVYTAKEITAPKGYALDTATHKLTITSGQTTTLNVTDAPKNDPVDILLKKVDAVTGTNTPYSGGSLAGAEFTINYYAGNYSTAGELKSVKPARTWVVKTDKDGYVILSKDYLVSGDEFYYTGDNKTPTLPLGTITIQETKAPAGYNLNSELFIRQITSDDGVVESVQTYNAPTVKEERSSGGFTITKVDALSIGYKIAGAEFTVYADKACTKIATNFDGDSTKAGNTFVTDSGGIAKSKSYELDKTYYIKETKAPEGYLFSDKVWEAKLTSAHAGKSFVIGDKIQTGIDYQGNAVYDWLVLNTPTKVPGRISLQKMNSERDWLQGATFAAYAETDFYSQDGELIYKKDSLITLMPTIGMGVVELNIPNIGKGGKIKIVEHTAPLGYYKDTEAYYVYSFNPENGYSYDGEGNPFVAGVITAVSNEEDEWLIGKSSANFTNYCVSGKLSIAKKDDLSGEGLKGAIFEVTADEDFYDIANVMKTKIYSKGDKITTIVMGNNTQGTLKGLTIGSGGRIKIVETKAPEGYKLADKVEDRTYYMYFDSAAYDESNEVAAYCLDGSGNKLYTLTVINNRPTGSLQVKKTSEDGIIEGHTFKAVGSDGGTYEGVTGEDGTVKWDNLPVITTANEKITYTVYENDTALRYNGIAPQSTTLTENTTTTLSFKNTLKTGSLKINKESEDGVIFGHQFSVIALNSKNEAYKGATGEDGTVLFEKLPLYNSENTLINYLLTENDVPVRYVEPADQTVSIEHNKTKEITFKNTLKRVNLSLVKRAEGDTLEGFKFVIEGTNGFKQEQATNSEGKLVFEGLAIYDKENKSITYTVFEDGVPIYYITPQTQTITLIEESEENPENIITFDNNYKRGNLVITKTSDDGFIKDMEFTLKGTAANGNAIYLTAKTDSSGKAYFNNIPIGNYVITEVNIPARYIVPDSQTTEIAWDKTINLQFHNKIKTGILELTKTDIADGELLPNAGFEVLDEDMNVVVDGRTDESGKAYFEKLPYGKYYYREFDAPEGYEIDETPYPFEILENGQIHKAEMTNRLKPVDVKTLAQDTNGNKLVKLSKDTVLQDIVSLHGLIVGKEYEQECIWYDKESGEMLHHADGTPVSTKIKFIATEIDMEVIVETTLDSTLLAGKQIVAGENTFLKGILIGVHFDLTDEDQTITFEEIPVEPPTQPPTEPVTAAPTEPTTEAPTVPTTEPVTEKITEKITSIGTGENIDTDGNGDNIDSNGDGETVKTGNDNVLAVFIAIATLLISAFAIITIYNKRKVKSPLNKNM